MDAWVVNLLWTYSALCAMVTARSWLVHRYRARRFVEVMVLSRQQQIGDDGWGVWWRLVDAEFEILPRTQILDLTKWTYRQFYPKPLEVPKQEGA